MPKFLSLFLAAFLLVSCSQESEQMATSPLIIKTANGEVRFNVEVASTPQQLKTGLMNRNSLAFNSGMIFNIYPVRPTAMWMKNTKIPLDMLFVGPDTNIVMIRENAVPMSEEQIISRDPVRAVIELNAGQVKRHGIRVGDQVTHALLNNMLNTETNGEEEIPDNRPDVPVTPPPAAAENLPQYNLDDLPDPDQIGVDQPQVEAPAIDKKTPETPSKKTPQKLPQPAPAAPTVPVPAPSL